MSIETELVERKKLYQRAANHLCYRGGGELLPYGSLFRIGGPLRAGSDISRSAKGYFLQRPLHFVPSEEPDKVPDWNLDYTLPVEVAVIRGKEKQITVEEFVGRFVTAQLFNGKMDEFDASEATHVSVLSTALRMRYEQKWLDYQQQELRKSSELRTTRRAKDVTDEAFRSLAVDVPIRQAKVAEMSNELIELVKKAHFPNYNSDRIMRDISMNRLMGGCEDYSGPTIDYGMTREQAGDILFGVDRGVK